MNRMLRSSPLLLLTSLGCATAPPASVPAKDVVLQPPQVETAEDFAAVLRRTVEVTGGQAFWRTVQTMDFGLNARLMTPEGQQSATARILFRMPDEMYRGNVLENVGEINMLVKGRSAWFQPPQQTSLRPASPAEADYIRAGVWRDLAFLLARFARNAAPGGRLLEPEQIGGRTYDVLQIQPPDELPGYRLYIDRSSGLPMKRVFAQDDDTVVEDHFSNYHVRDGARLPRVVRSYRNGVLGEEIDYEFTRINVPVDMRFFSDPDDGVVDRG